MQLTIDIPDAEIADLAREAVRRVLHRNQHGDVAPWLEAEARRCVDNWSITGALKEEIGKQIELAAGPAVAEVVAKRIKELTRQELKKPAVQQALGLTSKDGPDDP